MSKQLFLGHSDSCTLGIMSKASAKAWTPRRAPPFTLHLYVLRASAIATSAAPAPGTTQPIGGEKWWAKHTTQKNQRKMQLAIQVCFVILQLAIKVCFIIVSTSKVYLNIYRSKVSCIAQWLLRCRMKHPEVIQHKIIKYGTDWLQIAHFIVYPLV